LNRYLKKQSGTITPCANISSSTAVISNYDLVVAGSSSYVLAKDVVFDAVGTTISNIIFRPPDPQISFFDKNGVILPSAVNGSIVIMNSSGGGKINISVGPGGQITYNFVD
jgi:hypothetical protein